MEEQDKTMEFEIEEKEEIKKEEPKEKKKKVKKKSKLKEKWKSLSKKKKIIIIVIAVIVIIGIGIGTFLIVKSHKKPVEEKKIVLENQNYRYENGVLIFLDKSKKELGRYTCKNKSEKKCYLAYYSKDDTLDNTKYIYEDDSPVLFQTPIIEKKYAFIYDNEKKTDETVKLYDFKAGKQKELYTDIKKANDDYTFIVKDDEGKYGIISLKNEFKNIIGFKYDYLSYYDDSKTDYYLAFDSDRYFLLDKDAKEVSKPIKEKIVGYSVNYLKAKNDESYVVYDYKGNKILDKEYDFISFAGDFIIAIKDNMLYVIDKDGNNLNYDGIKLNNKDYQRTYIYDKKNKLKEILKSYEIEQDDNTIMVKVFDGKEETISTINLVETQLNAKLEYISYISGKLYFYNDSEKKNLLGSYTCKNKNTITSADSVLSNCFIAKENETYLPIINERYVFINDTLESSKQSIYLYDLKQSKSLSNYLEVNTGANIASDNNFYTTSSLDIIALSAKKNKYGVIRIGKEDVKNVVEFSNNQIVDKTDYYLVLRSNNKYTLFDKSGNNFTGEFDNEITEYDPNTNVVYIKTDDKYKLYQSNGKEITKKPYEYIDVYGSYIVAINGKKLDVINYDSSLYCEKCGDIELTTTDYKKAYSISKDKIVVFEQDGTVKEEILFKEEE